MPSKVWRSQLPAIQAAVRWHSPPSDWTDALVTTYNAAPYHYWSLCALSYMRATTRVPPNSYAHPDVLELSIDLDSAGPRRLAVDVCDEPATRASDWCHQANADTAQCRARVSKLVAQAKDVVARHHRPARQTLQLGDGSIVEVAISVGDRPSLLAAAYCAQWHFEVADCARLQEALVLMLPNYARLWCV